MPSSTVDAGAAPARPGVLGRALGVIFSPRETFQHVAADPKWFAALALVAVVGALAVGGFLMTEVGQRAWLDQAVTQSEAWSGAPVSDQQYAGMERMAPYASYMAIAQMVIGIPLVLAVLSGVLFAAFNAVLGGASTFRQLFAVVVHSTFIWVVGWIFVMPLNYARESMSSPTNLSAFVPMLDEQAFFTRLLGAVDLFMVWWTIVLAIGLAVLYRRRTQPILFAFLGIYAVIAIGVAAFLASRNG